MREYTTIPALNESGLSQVSIADLTGVDRGTVRKYRHDKSGDEHMVTVDEYECTEVYTLWTRRG